MPFKCCGKNFLRYEEIAVLFLWWPKSYFRRCVIVSNLYYPRIFEVKFKVKVIVKVKIKVINCVYKNQIGAKEIILTIVTIKCLYKMCNLKFKKS